MLHVKYACSTPTAKANASCHGHCSVHRNTNTLIRVHSAPIGISLAQTL